VARTTTRAASRPGDTADEAYVRLRDLIVEGVLLPGQRLPHNRLMEQLRVGRTPLRTALSRLQSDGLVVGTPNHGMTVAPAPVSSAEEVYALRLLVEPPLLELLAATITPAQLERLRELLARMESCANEPLAFQRAHREFHTAERATFPRPLVDSLVVDMYRHLYRYQRAHVVRPRSTQDFLLLDHATVDALEQRDGLRARRTLEFHLLDAALAFLLDVDPEHRPSLLTGVASANGIMLEGEEDGHVPRPTSISWRTPCATLPALRTANLVYEPEPERSTR
jgi:DNA-binding GntR family transcriptional regulator